MDVGRFVMLVDSNGVGMEYIRSFGEGGQGGLGGNVCVVG